MRGAPSQRGPATCARPARPGRGARGPGLRLGLLGLLGLLVTFGAGAAAGAQGAPGPIVDPIPLPTPDVAVELRAPRAVGHRRTLWLAVHVRNVGSLAAEVPGVELSARWSDGAPAGRVRPLFRRAVRLRPGGAATAWFRWTAPSGEALDREPVLLSACARAPGDADTRNDCDLVLRGRRGPVETPRIVDRFDGPSLDPYWEAFRSGTGESRVGGGTAAFSVTEESHAGEYSDAEINDYRRGFERGFPWGPGTRVVIRARASDDNGRGASPGRGTRGFGFWNLETGGPGAPDGMSSAWFISVSPESFGFGVFMAAVFDGGRPSLLEPVFVDLRRWHEYGIVWTRRGVTFSVDDRPVAASGVAPEEKLGFVAWIDNYRLTFSPSGIETDFLDLDRDQTLYVDEVRIGTLGDPGARNGRNGRRLEGGKALPDRLRDSPRLPQRSSRGRRSK